MKKRKLLMLLLCVVSLFILTACGSEEKKEEETNNNYNSQKVEKEEKKEKAPDFLHCKTYDDSEYIEIAFYYDRETQSTIKRISFTYEIRNYEDIEGYNGSNEKELAEALNKKICSSNNYSKCKVAIDNITDVMRFSITTDGYQKNDVLDIPNASMKENLDYYENLGYTCYTQA